MEPCMCGDTRCGSCGPAQGNSKCYACGEWADEHAEHGAGSPGCKHDDARCEVTIRRMDAAMADAEAEDRYCPEFDEGGE